MIVYGDLASSTTVAELVTQLRQDVAATADPDRARRVLIRAGQLEQAIADAATSPELVARAMAITDAAAQALVAGADETGGANDPDGISLLLDELERTAHAGGTVTVTAKVPEGFEIYTLYPEQYARSAARWAVENPSTRADDIALVVGIRSIGTTLSAVVAATLVRAGRRVRRITVRPSGHPFDRVVELDSGVCDAISAALVVDEGPGLSGSSMSSVAAALEAGGVDAASIVFLPGHGGDPGNAAPDHVRARWASTPRVVTRVAEVRWGDRSLPEVLADASGLTADQIVDVSAGMWRSLAYANPDAWPAACTRFERTKYLCRRDDGPAVLWKFTGHTSPASPTPTSGPKPLAERLGFTATTWVDGARLVPADAHESVLSWLGMHVAGVARSPLRTGDAEAALARLVEIVACNTDEALGPDAAARARALVTSVDRGELPAASAGDGRMAPHEVVLDGDGRLWKVGGGGYSRDHTAVGRQSVLWDVAGAIVEWQLDDARARHLVTAVERAGAIHVGSAALFVHVVAYAAFRVGQTSLCADLEAETAERDRLTRACRGYTATLSAALDQELGGPANTGSSASSPALFTHSTHGP